MAKFIQMLFIALLTIAFCTSEAPRSRTFLFQARHNRFLARQEVAESAAVTPYPSSDELKPEVSFDETVPAEEQQPYQPDEIYGPPEDEVTIETDDEERIEQFAEVEYTPARLTARRTSSVRKSLIGNAKLRRAFSERLLFDPQPVFYYVAQ